jgi:hypothetical protein
MIVPSRPKIWVNRPLGNTKKSSKSLTMALLPSKTISVSPFGSGLMCKDPVKDLVRGPTRV